MDIKFIFIFDDIKNIYYERSNGIKKMGRQMY